MNANRYGRFFERALLPLWETVIRGRRTQSFHRQLERSQFCSRDQLEALREGELRRLLRHAFTHVPFYRARFEAAGLRPEDIRAVADLSRLPQLTRPQAIDSYDQRASRAAPLPTITKSTGGTTGQPLRFGYDQGSEDFREAVKRRGWGWAGYRPGSPTLFYWLARHDLSPKEKIKIPIDRAIRREHYVDCAHRGVAELDAVAETIRRAPPNVIISFSQAIADLARHVNERGLKRWGTIPVLCAAEGVSKDDRAVIAEAFGPSVFETYGCREMMLIGAECEAHDGLHTSAENLIVELVVEENGTERAARPGEVGEVVITDLHNYGMPFIRYAIGDRAVAAAEGVCACGRSLPRLASIEGRVAETLRDADGARVSGLVFNVLLTRYAQQVRQFQAVQRRDGKVTLKLVANRPIDEVTRRNIHQASRELLPGVELETLVVDEIPLGKSGKRRFVVVER